MSELNDGEFSLLSLEDELTCSICLSAFDCPVTIPCGHNFCQNCLLSIWTDTYSCPQCQSHFPAKPELKKNTVLATVVQTFKMKQIKGEDNQGEEVQVQKQAFIHCDTCMEAEASQTCFTCMASFCEEHLRPHRENPTFRLHQLSESASDLSDRICPDHNKLFELFCTQHDRLICSLCLQQAHKGCDFMTTEQRRNVKEADLRDKLGLLDEKIEKNEAVISKMSDIQSKLKDAAANKKGALVEEYQQIRDILDRELSDALSVVDLELASGQAKLRNQTKRFAENVEKMSKAKEELRDLQTQTQTLAFLQASFDLPSVVKFDPYAPRMNLDSKKVMAVQAFAAGLKEQLMELLKQPVEARLLMIHADENAGENEAAALRPESAADWRPESAAESAAASRAAALRAESAAAHLAAEISQIRWQWNFHQERPKVHKQSQHAPGHAAHSPRGPRGPPEKTHPHGGQKGGQAKDKPKGSHGGQKGGQAKDEPKGYRAQKPSGKTKKT